MSSILLRARTRHDDSAAFCAGRAWVLGLAAALGGVSTAQAMTSVGSAPATPLANPPTMQTRAASISTAAVDSSMGGGLSYAGTQTSNLGSFHINIIPNASLQANPDALAAFNNAAAMWEQYISDPITVNINAGLEALTTTVDPDGPGGDPPTTVPDTNIIGQTSAVLLNDPYSEVRNALIADSQTHDALNNSLPTQNQFGALMPTYTLTSGVKVAYTLAKNANDDLLLVGTKANFKALGFTGVDNILDQDGNPLGPTDATITFNSNFDFDYDNSNGVDPTKVDFQTTAAHEIGHALGFNSSVDFIDVDITSKALSQTPPTPDTTVAIPPSILDLYRFLNNDPSNDPDTAGDFTSDARDLVPGHADITDFVLAGLSGADLENLMSTGFFNGDGNQASHWKDNNLLGDTGTSIANLIGIMDPTLAKGQTFPITPADLQALSLIGYDITAVPEPATLLLLAAGGGLMMLGRRRRA